MNKAQKTVQLGLLQSEQHCIEQLEKAYKQALKDINAQIKQYQGDELTQSQIYQKQYQEALKAQVSAILDKMQADHYGTVQGYLKGCYEDSYIGVMYDLQQAGIPVTVPIQQDQVVKAVTTDSKLSKPLYESMGKYLKPLKKRVAAELTRGFASALHFNDIARSIANVTGIGLSNAKRIARTEGHRIQNAAALDAQKEAKDMGADVVKQWDSTMDGKTRKSHRKLDGQIREIDEPFEVGGHKAMAPGQFGRPEEDINCRCTILQRARWALDEDELKVLEDKAAFWGLDKSDEFEDFKKKYLKQSGIQEEKAVKLAESQLKAGKDAMEAARNAAKGLKDAYEKANKAFKDAVEQKSGGFSFLKLNQFKKTGDLSKLGIGKGDYQLVGGLYDKQKSLKSRAQAAAKGATDAEMRYESLKERLEDAQSAYKHALKKAQEMAKGVDSQKSVKDLLKSCRKFATRYDADDYFRSKTEELWQILTPAERKSVYTYTTNAYYDMNSHLRFGNSASDYIKKHIRNATKAIDKSIIQDDIVVRRGVQANGAAGLLGVNKSDLSDIDVQNALIGQVVTDKGFVSCGVSEDAGFDGINLEIYVPAGTKGVYAEPFSAYGSTNSDGTWDGKQKGHGVGGEAELILQRDTHFEVVRIDSDSYGHIRNIVLAVVGQQ